MSGVGIVVQLAGFEAAQALFTRLVDFDEEQLLSDIGGLGESQTRKRIEEEKAAPDGTAWPPNLTGTSILLATGQHLRDSVAYITGSGEVAWGASREFAHVHQDGAVISAKNAKALRFPVGGKWVAKKSVAIPARPFVGLSEANAQEITEHVTDVLGKLAP